MQTTLRQFARGIALASVLVVGCSGDLEGRSPGETDFVSAPPNGGGATGGGALDPGASNTNGAAGGTAQPTAPAAPRAVEETDLYRVDGNRLYYLNAYRGLMVFDVTDVDQPTLLGRSPIFGTPVDMVVNNGIAVVVVADWYGTLDDGTPFHGSIVRGLDATDPTQIKVLGDARLGGWVQDDRVVGNVIYAVSEDYGWNYGWWVDNGTNTESVVVSSVSFANNVIQAVDQVALPGYSGVFNVTPNSIMLAHDILGADDSDTGQTGLLYLDISDPGGAIVQRGSLTVDGMVEGWGADNGRWNLDFADGATAHVIGCAGASYCDGNSGFVLSTADFTDPDHPSLTSVLDIASPGWSAAARFDTGRLYLSPSEDDYNDGTSTTPFQVFDLTVPAAPRLAGTVTIPGEVWNILPAPSSRIFALGNDGNADNSVSLTYLDVTNPAAPAVLGNSEFGQGWAWTPAAGTFKAFTMDATQGLVVIPFSGWSDQQQVYTNGLQLIEFTPTTETTAAAARTTGWVERGIFVGNRLVSLSDTALAVVDYTNPDAPTVVTELTLARNVVASRPTPTAVAEVSSDWWDNDVTTSQVRMLPIANADETTDSSGVPTLNVAGVDAQVFTNASFAYVVTNVQVPCAGSGSADPECREEQVEVVDLSSGLATPRGSIRLPADPWGWYGIGWYGFGWGDWYDGAEVVQIGGDALAFRRWEPVYDAAGNFVASNTLLYLVDLSNPDAPHVASTTIQPDPNAWWGNMQVVGTTLYTSHYEWYRHPGEHTDGLVKYFVDGIDLSDRSNPRVRAKINVPGLLVGGDPDDPSLLYTVDYRWDGDNPKNDFDVVRIDGNRATLQSVIRISGWMGSTFVRGTTAYASAQRYPDPNNPFAPTIVDLHAIDLSQPRAPVDRVVSDQRGWGWLLDVEGDRALVTSGWGPDGLDIYQLTSGAPPTFSQTVRTRGWWIDAATRQGSQLFLSSGYWGVQTVQLQ